MIPTRYLPSFNAPTLRTTRPVSFAAALAVPREEAEDGFSAGTFNRDKLNALIDANDIGGIEKVLKTSAKDSIQRWLKDVYDESPLSRLFNTSRYQNTDAAWWKSRLEMTRKLVSCLPEGYLQGLFAEPYYAGPVWDTITHGRDMSEEDAAWTADTLIPEAVRRDPRQMGLVLLEAVELNNPRFLKAALELVKATGVNLAEDDWLDVMGILLKTESQKLPDRGPLMRSLLWGAIPENKRLDVVQKTGLLGEVYGDFQERRGVSERVLETLDALPSEQRLEALRDMNGKVPLLSVPEMWEYGQFTVRPGSRPAWQEIPEPQTSFISDALKQLRSGFGSSLQSEVLPFYKMNLLANIQKRLSEPEQRAFLELPVPFPSPQPGKPVSVPLYKAIFYILYLG